MQTSMNLFERVVREGWAKRSVPNISGSKVAVLGTLRFAQPTKATTPTKAV